MCETIYLSIYLNSERPQSMIPSPEDAPSKDVVLLLRKKTGLQPRFQLAPSGRSTLPPLKFPRCACSR